MGKEAQTAKAVTTDFIDSETAHVRNGNASAACQGLQRELKAEEHTELSDIGIFRLIEVSDTVYEVYTEKLQDVFHPISQFDIRRAP